MKSNEIIKEMMNKTQTTQKQLQEALELKSLSSITGFLKSDVRCATLQRLAATMGYKVAVVPENTELPENSYLVE